MSIQDRIPLQLEELQLIKFSLLPGELFSFLDDSCRWTTVLDSFTETGALTDETSSDLRNLPPASFQIRLEDKGSRLYFEAEIPSSYTPLWDDVSVEERAKPVILAKGNITQQEQENIHAMIKEKLEEIEQSQIENPLFQLVSLHLVPLLHDDLSKQHDQPIRSLAANGADTAQQTDPTYHVLFTSHHLIAQSKRRALQQWASEHNLLGFAKVGHPGVIYAYGPRSGIDELVRNVKALQWLALRVRFVEPLDEGHSPNEGGGGGTLGAGDVQGRPRWVEFEKVGKVVEEMRRLGREAFVVEMGIGSAGNEK
ncbi:hypothetical protein HGRIS_008744 [Hohenbuehelia grisea]|uniref:Uncharacterized protein n=1 Tax=Hohenbuehelia grisea TaxID=104357 RepID=A0ABR3J8Z9_9AGAR